MKAVVVEDFKQRLRVKDVAEPRLRGPFDALVRIHASGVCHTDLHAADGDWPVKPTLPFIPGHEGVSVVGSIVGTRKDLQEALELAARGLVTCNYTTARMEEINDVFGEMRAGKIDGRVVLKIR